MIALFAEWLTSCGAVTEGRPSLRVSSGNAEPASVMQS